MLYFALDHLVLDVDPGLSGTWIKLQFLCPILLVNVVLTLNYKNKYGFASADFQITS